MNVFERAKDFLENEREFHLGFLHTEQSNPKTKNLDSAFKKSSADGVKLLLSVDRDIVPMARKIFRSDVFKKLENSILKSLSDAHKVVFSGCGATGRLSILLETMWRRSLFDVKDKYPDVYEHLAKYQDSVMSIMTGGDYALIRSVESFEDYASFGRRQVNDMKISAGDTLVAITEGGETSSVLGTAEEAAAKGAAVFLIFNNPAELLCRHIERSRKAIKNPGITVLDLSCGSMALSGSTRMQAASSEQLIAGAALENVFQKLLEKEFNADIPDNLKIGNIDWSSEFDLLLDELSKTEAVDAMASHIEFEEAVYKKKGLLTYYGNEMLLDIFTDTTERAPTFMLPPFRKCDDCISQPSWAFVKNPLLPTAEAWHSLLARDVRCLDWTSEDYEKMGAAERIIKNQPKLDASEIMKFKIGFESDASRIEAPFSAAILIIAGEEYESKFFDKVYAAFEKSGSGHSEKRVFVIGSSKVSEKFCHLPCRAVNSPLGLLRHLAVKLVLNTISTATMVRLGRVSGNWMSFVEVSNKKLADRSIRLIAELCKIDYKTACLELFKTLDEIERSPNLKHERISPVQRTMDRLKKGAE